MKIKITSLLVFLASSVFAFAGTEVPENNSGICPACGKENAPQQQQIRNRRQAPERRTPVRRISREMRGAFVMHMLLAMDDAQLDELAKRIETVRKMTPEEKAEARKALPKPEMRRGVPEKQFRGKQSKETPANEK